MNINEQLITTFYRSFQKLDAAGMNECYSPDAVFFDPVFGLLNTDELKAMWAMLCNNAKDLEITFENITSIDDEYYTCNWTATYTFSRTGRKVVNKIKAYMRFSDGKIIEHSDAFSLYKWTKQAFGITGFLLGWSNFFQKKIRKQARQNLEKFMLKTKN
ncbi:MAG TPA: nuclear transport factor 2 family protein [Ferruginibacter sp.]|nr:nuclear transport factor 2 family protein [Ferruginibacter sp.]